MLYVNAATHHSTFYAETGAQVIADSGTLPTTSGFVTTPTVIEFIPPPSWTVRGIIVPIVIIHYRAWLAEPAVQLYAPGSQLLGSPVHSKLKLAMGLGPATC